MAAREPPIYFSYESVNIAFAETEVIEPLTLLISFFSVRTVSATKKKLTLSDANPSPDVSVTFTSEDFSSITNFYKSLHEKVPGCPPHSHFFVYARKILPGWDGFISTETHLNILMTSLVIQIH